MNIFLRLKHWQLFLLLYILPGAVMGWLLWQTVNQEDPFALLTGLPWWTAGYVFVFFGWHWTVGNSLHARLPESVQMNVNLFRIFQIIPAIYIITVIWFVTSLVGHLQPEDMQGSAFPFSVLAIIPFHFFSVFCIIYCLWFVAKCLKSVELQKNASFSEFLTEFVLFWLLPIGIWFIQPRINAIFENRQPSDDFSF